MTNHGGKRIGAGRKSSWESGCKKEDTKSIRIPKKISDKVMSFAHLQDAVDINSFPSVEVNERANLPEIAAIYFVLNSSREIQYIGQSKNINSRWRYHQKLKELKDTNDIRIAYMAISDVDLLFEVEQALIRHFNPPLNLDNPFNQKSDSPRVVKTFRMTDECWKIFGELAKEKGMTKADYLEWMVREMEKDKLHNDGIKLLEEALLLKANAGGAIKKKIRKYLELFR